MSDYCFLCPHPLCISKLSFSFLHPNHILIFILFLSFIVEHTENTMLSNFDFLQFWKLSHKNSSCDIIESTIIQISQTWTDSIQSRTQIHFVRFSMQCFFLTKTSWDFYVSIIILLFQISTHSSKLFLLYHIESKAKYTMGRILIAKISLLGTIFLYYFLFLPLCQNTSLKQLKWRWDSLSS